MATITLRDARWDCGMCGFCCTFVTLGPVEPEIVRALEDRGVAERWPEAARGWYTLRGGQYFLERRDGACVFLRSDRRCAVHALYGAEAKPGFCREFPYRAVALGADTAVVVRGDCSGAHEHFRDGTPVAERAERVIELTRVAPRARFDPGAVEVLPGRAVDPGTWLGWERALLDELAGAAPTPEAAVARIRERLAERVGAALDAPDPARARLAGRAALEGLALVARGAADRGGGSPAEEAFVLENLGWMRRAQADWGRPPPLSGDSAEYLNLLLRSELLGKQVQAAGGLMPGLGRFLLAARVARVAGGGELPGLARVLSRFLRFANNRAALEVLRLARPALVDLYLNAGEG